METHLRTELVLAALEMAIGQRKPHNVIHHSDQGSQAGLKWSSQHLEGRSRDEGSTGGVRTGLVGRYCSHRVARWWQDEMSSAGSGRRSRQAWRVKMLRCKLGCRSL
jgi:transposase InsO family protein